MVQTKFIFVTGGVYSSLGKGVTASSIGRILKQLGFSVTMQKLDPYLNVDPAFISPLQHGEVFITNDGAKADLDLGNYERFIDHNLNQYSTVTSGRIYQEVINKERHNEYGGKTIQIIPHITNQIIEKIKKLQETNQTDFAIIEIGGTVGDIESLPFIHAICEFTYRYGQENVMFAHCVPLISVASVVGELKTKPAQHSVKTLRSLGVSPDLLLLRSNQTIDKETRYKLSWSCGINESKIFECMDLSSTYFLPEALYEQKIQDIILSHFKMTAKVDNFSEWLKFTDSIKAKKNQTLNIAIIGEYVELHDAYFSAKAALDITSYKLNVGLNVEWFQVNDLSNTNYDKTLKSMDAILVTPVDGQDAKINTAKLLLWLGNKTIPTLVYGTAFECLINAQFNQLPDDLFIEQNEYTTGAQSTNLSDLMLINYFGGKVVSERHHHKNEFNNYYLNELPTSLEVVGLRNDLVDIIKIQNHPFFYATYSNPEFNSKPLKPDPLYLAWLTEGKKHHEL